MAGGTGRFLFWAFLLASLLAVFLSILWITAPSIHQIQKDEATILLADLVRGATSSRVVAATGTTTTPSRNESSPAEEQEASLEAAIPVSTQANETKNRKSASAVATNDTTYQQHNLGTNNETKTTLVFLWPRDEKSARTSHIFVDGIRESPHLKLLRNLSEATDYSSVVWLVDLATLAKEKRKQQKQMQRQASGQSRKRRGGRRRRRNQALNNDTKSDAKLLNHSLSADGEEEVIPPPWMRETLLQHFHVIQRIVLVDYSDHALDFKYYREIWRHVQNVTAQKADKNLTVTLAIRSTAERRSWNKKEEWVSTGRRIASVRYQHIPFPVRTDTVEKLETYLAQQHLKLLDPIESRLKRPVDVTHLWPVNDTSGVAVQQLPTNDTTAQEAGNGGKKRRGGKKGKGKKGRSAVGGAKMGKLRFRVSQLIQEWGEQEGWTTFVRLAGAIAQKGRRGVQDEYIRALTQTKILVVAQRDYFEDHYRLMEALSASGACVFTDAMHGLPSGLQNGTSIVTFQSAQELKQLLQYYLHHQAERLEIARRGRLVAMSRHRAWHRMEEIVLGRIPTTVTCDEMRNTSNECSALWTVHRSGDFGERNDETSNAAIGLGAATR